MEEKQGPDSGKEGEKVSDENEGENDGKDPREGGHGSEVLIVVYICLKTIALVCM